MTKSVTTLPQIGNPCLKCKGRTVILKGWLDYCMTCNSATERTTPNSKITIYRIHFPETGMAYPPWTDAIGIEEVEMKDGEQVYEYPPIKCWFTRGYDNVTFANKIVRLLNGDIA